MNMGLIDYAKVKNATMVKECLQFIKAHNGRVESVSIVDKTNGDGVFEYGSVSQINSIFWHGDGMKSCILQIFIHGDSIESYQVHDFARFPPVEKTLMDITERLKRWHKDCNREVMEHESD